MATFAFSTVALPQGVTFIFGSWVCIANCSDGFDSHLAKTTKLEAISSESCDFAAGSSNLGEMLLPDLAKEIEQKPDVNSSSTRSQSDLSPSSSWSGTLHVQPIYGLHNSSFAYQKMMKSIYSAQGVVRQKFSCHR